MPTMGKVDTEVSVAEPASDAYADALRREIMRSELQRMRVLAIILARLCLPSRCSRELGARVQTGTMFRGGIAGWMPLP